MDTENNPIPGVNIVINKTALGTVTDYDGHFKLIIGNEPSMVLLLIRFIGYSSVDFEINTEKGYNYKLRVNLEEGRKRRVKRNKPIEKVKRD